MKDLYRLANGQWLDTHTIPADRGIDGMFHQLRDQSEADVRTIVETTDTLAATIYSSFMDIEGIESIGINALDSDFALIDNANNITEFAHALGVLNYRGIASPISFWVNKDTGANGTDAILYVNQDGLGLPDEVYYHDPAYADILAKYRNHIETMLGFLPKDRLFGYSPAEAADIIVALETNIASGHWNVVDSRDALKTFNPDYELPPLAKEILNGSKVPETPIITRMPSYVDHLEQLFRNEPLEHWKLWAFWTILTSRAEYLTQEISQTDFEFFGTELSGATEQRARWKRGLSLAEVTVGHETGKHFVERHFPPEAKAEMLDLVDYLLQAYEERITSLPWMTPETREKALVKLSKFRAKIGYPEKWRTYEGLEFSPRGEDLMENIRAAMRVNTDYQLNKLGKPVDRDEWFATPQTVNAFYNPSVNDITFPAAILRPPFYSIGGDAATNFGAIGAVIGHEIGHGFDDQGSQYDGEGNINSWWTDEDRAAFETLTAKLVKQFDGRVPSVLKGTDSSGVNGQFTLGENIGDLGGLGIAVIAYRRYLADRGLTFETDAPAQVDTEGGSVELTSTEYTGLQRLFLSWARIWRTAVRPEYATQALATDPHSPAEFRCNIIVGNIPEFYTAFDVEEDGESWIHPDERVAIW